MTKRQWSIGDYTDVAVLDDDEDYDDDNDDHHGDDDVSQRHLTCW